MTHPDATDETPDDPRVRRRMIPRLKAVLLAWTAVMAVFFVLALSGFGSPVNVIAGLGPFVYVLARRFIEGSFDWMYEVDTKATTEAFLTTKQDGSPR